MANTDLNIKIKSKLGSTRQVLLYQKAITYNVKNFKTAAWEHGYIAPGATMEAILPMEVCIGAYEGIGYDGKISTKLLRTEYNTAWDIYNNHGTIDIRKSKEPAPEESTIEIHNKNDITSAAIITKGGKPLLRCDLRPDFKVSFSLLPKLFIALSDFEIIDPFFDAATITGKPVGIDYEGQQCLNITLSENESTGAVEVKYDFS